MVFFGFLLIPTLLAVYMLVFNHKKIKLREFFAQIIIQCIIAALSAVVVGAMKGRYGEDGSKAVFQFLQEQNPNVNANLYQQIQQVIEAGRNSFEADQKTLLDKKRVYETGLRQFPQTIIATVLGFPKLDMKQIDIITSDETEKAFQAKKTNPIQVK